MKFAKRLASEASRKEAFSAAYFDYRAAKKAIKDDLLKSDVAGSNFQMLLETELRKVSQFYSNAADRLESSLRELHGSRNVGGVQQLTTLRSEIKELIKFVALNYLAVVKAIKKRNRHLRQTFGAAASISLQALDMLGHEVFFTSPRLATLATQADVLVSGLISTGGVGPTSDVLQEYQCPICLDTLHNPVVLTCAHRFCWGCLVAHVTAVRHQQPPSESAAGADDKATASVPTVNCSLQLLERIAAAVDEAEQQQRFYSCPVCRKPQLLDVDTLSVDPFLSSFIESLKVLSVDAVPATIAGTAGTTAAAAAVTAPSDSASTVAGASAIITAAVVKAIQVTTAAASNGTVTELLAPEPQPSPSAAVVPAVSSTPCSQLTAALTQSTAAGAAAAARPTSASSASPAPPVSTPASWGIIPPQRPEHIGRLCVLLDLDGTLVSSYTPRRAPRLPPYVRTHVVGVGSSLNPAGVFVVERPGLREFLTQLAGFAEVIVFTAGLEDYAGPIIDAIDPDRSLFAYRIYREGTLRTDYYQCVKDMARLGRLLSRTVLVDDTPLAFLHQPDNGVPVLGFRGDPDDRLLVEAVLPLMQVLSKESDVRTVLQRRFDMTTWFRRNSFPIDSIVAQAAEAARQEALRHVGGSQASPSSEATGADSTITTASSPASYSSAASTASSSSTQTQHHQAQSTADTTTSGVLVSINATRRYAFTGPRVSVPTKRFLLLTDFDKTLSDCDAGEAVVEALAPELLPMLVGHDPRVSFIPLTNTLLAEIQRRGVSRDGLLATIQSLGSEMPLASVEMLRMISNAGIDIKILSDANSVFIGHMMAGAKVVGCVQDVITNPASFERVAVEPTVSTAASGGTTIGGAAAGVPRSVMSTAVAGQRLVIRPHFNPADPYLVLPPAVGGGDTNTGGASKDKPSTNGSGANMRASSSISVPGSSGGGGVGVTSADNCKGAGTCTTSSTSSSSFVEHHGGAGCCEAHRRGSTAVAGGAGASFGGHGCPRCPSNMCKGLEVQRLLHANTYSHIVYCGDGSNDVCAALSLRAKDVVLARAGYPLARFIEASRGETGAPQVAAQVAFWSTHEELLACVRQVMDV